MKEPVYQSNILHKKYTDVNANSKYYYPQKEDNIMSEQINFKTQWTNRANKILLDSQNLISPKAQNQKSAAHPPFLDIHRTKKKSKKM